jgi:cysteine-rich repeat protein
MIRFLGFVSLLLVSGCIFEASDDAPGPSHYCGDGIVDPPVETCDDGNTVAGDGCSATCKLEQVGNDAAITASWQLKNLATNSAAACPRDYDTAAIYNQPIDAAGNNVGTPVIDLFDCIAKTGTASNLEPTRYLTWVEITNHDNTSVFAKSLSAVVDVTNADKSFAAEILVDGGYFQMQWNLVGKNSGQPRTCAQAGAAGGVESVATDVSTPANAASDRFDCEDGYGVTAGFLAATYTVSISALNGADQAVGTAPTLTNKIIGEKNAVTDLGTIMIPIDGQ